MARTIGDKLEITIPISDGPFEENFAEVADAIIADHIQPLRTESEILRAEVERLARINADICASHNALLADGAKWEARALTAEAERDAAIARAEEAERKAHEQWRDVFGQLIDALAWAMDEENKNLTAEASVSALTAKLAQAEGEIATMRSCLEQMLPGPLCGEAWGCPDTERVSIVVTFGAIRAARAALTTPEHPHGD